MKKLIHSLLIVGLASLALGLLIPQIAIPSEALWYERSEPEVAGMAIPLSILAILGIACVQAVLVMMIRLVMFVDADEIFDPRALKWVNAIIVTIAIATCLVLVTLFYLGFNVPGGPHWLVLFGLFLFGLAATALMWLMRGLLVKAIEARTELAEVI